MSPLITKDQLLGVTEKTLQGAADPVAETEGTIDPSFMETQEAWFKKDNTVFNVVKESIDKDVEDRSINANFSPTPDKYVGYEEHASKFALANSDEDIDIIKLDIEHERYQNDVIARSGTWSNVVGAMAANALDPLAFIPIIGTIGKGTRAAKVVGGAAQGALFGAAGGIARESILQQTQAIRTIDESLINIAAESGFGAVLGGGIAGLSKGARNAGTAVFGEALKDNDIPIKIDADGKLSVDKSASAAEAKSGLLDNEGLVHINKSLAKGLSGFGLDSLTSPVVRGVTSSFGSVRQMTNKLLSHNFILNKQIKGVSKGDVAEDLIRQRNTNLIEVDTKTVGLYNNYLKRTAPEDVIPTSEFKKRVARINRDSSIVDEIDEVNQTAKIYRENLDSLAKEMQDLEILPKDLDPTTAKNYLMRAYDMKVLRSAAGEKAFIKKAGSWISKHHSDGRLRNNILDESEGQSHAMDVLDKLRRESDAQLGFSDMTSQIASKGKFNKPRTFLMPDNELEDFLVNDVDQLFKVYHNKAVNVIETQKRLNELGYDNFNDFRKELKSEKDIQLSKAKNEKEREAIQKAFNKDLSLMDDVYAMMLGNGPKSHPAISYLKAFQFTRLLGGVTLSSIPELWMAPFRQGLGKTIRDGYLPMLRSWKATKIAKAQFRDIDVGLEMEQNQLLKIITGVDDDAGRIYTSKWDDIVSSSVDKFAKYTGLSYLTAFERRMAAHVASADIHRKLFKFRDTGKLSDKEVRELANFGIGTKDYDRVIKQMNKHSEEVKGSIISNHHNWTDPEAIKVFKRAVQTQVESTVIKPFKGEIPLVAQNTAIGQVIFQFKSFSAAATNRILISGIQRGDARAITGIMGLASMGALSAVVKAYTLDKATDFTADELIMEGITRSGVAGLIGTQALEFSNTLIRPDRRRYAGDTALSNLIGPTGGMIKDVATAMGNVIDGEVSNSDVQRALRLLPFVNLFYIQAITNRIFDKEKK